MKKLFFFILFFGVSLTASAKYTQTCHVRYKKNYNWSEYYTINVTFLTGSELNQAINRFDYEMFEVYAVIFWDKDEVSIIQLSDKPLCGGSVTQSCITGSFNNFKGEDKSGRAWEICIKEYCY